MCLKNVIYIYALTWQKVLIYFFTRGIILLGIVNIKKREESIRSMIEQCCGIIVITGALLCAVLFKYQLWLDEMANGSKPIRGINASMNLYIMKYTIAKMFQILRHNRWVSILMIIEIALGMSVFTYSLNMFFSLSREKENQKNQERDLVLEISGGEGMNDIEKQAFTLKDYEKVDEITDGQTFLYVVLPQFYSYKNENYEFVMILVDYKKLDLKNG